MDPQAWDQGLDLGHSAIDGEHHLQIDLVNAIALALEAGEARQARSLLDQLLDYTNVHFASEELLMRYRDYPQYAAHEQEHRRLLDELERLRSAVLSRDGARASAALDDIRRWFAAHVLGPDRRLATHLAASSQAA
jgi:hemerythrin